MCFCSIVHIIRGLLRHSCASCFYQIALLKILLAAAPTSKAKTDSINILADVLPEEMP